MFNMDALFSSPGLVKTAAKAIGLEAARLDVDPQDRSVWLSLRLRGHVQQQQLPTGQAFTLDQILSLLFPPQTSGLPDPALAVAAATDPPPP